MVLKTYRVGMGWGNGSAWRFVVCGVYESQTMNLQGPFTLTNWIVVHEAAQLAKAI